MEMVTDEQAPKSFTQGRTVSVEKMEGDLIDKLG